MLSLLGSQPLSHKEHPEIRHFTWILPYSKVLCGKHDYTELKRVLLLIRPFISNRAFKITSYYDDEQICRVRRRSGRHSLSTVTGENTVLPFEKPSVKRSSKRFDWKFRQWKRFAPKRSKQQSVFWNWHKKVCSEIKHTNELRNEVNQNVCSEMKYTKRCAPIWSSRHKCAAKWGKPNVCSETKCAKRCAPQSNTQMCPEMKQIKR
jgi:hypothetical protein